MSKTITKILISGRVLSRTYQSQEFLDEELNYDFIYSKDLKLSFYYKIYASIIFKILSIKYSYRSKTFKYRLLRGTGIFDILIDLAEITNHPSM